MAAPGATVDYGVVLRAMNSLDSKNTKKVILATLRKAANILKKETDRRGEIATHIRKYRKETIVTKKGKKKEKIRRIATVNVSRKNLEALVHILSDYRVKWFEMGAAKKGTADRKTKGYRYRNETHKKRKGKRFVYKLDGKGRNTGRIEPKHFFRDAQRATESQCFSYIKTNLSREIIKAWEKNSKN